jgi:hypothetical protein
MGSRVTQTLPRDLDIMHPKLVLQLSQCHDDPNFKSLGWHSVSLPQVHTQMCCITEP